MSNHVTITGNLGQDPELRFIASGKAVCTISVGDTPRRLNRDTNKWEDAGETLWLRCSIWGDAAETLAEFGRKGQRVVVTGRLKSRTWDTKEGEKRTVIECDADAVAIVPKSETQRSTNPLAQTDPWATQSAPQQPAQASPGGWGQAPADEPPFAFPPNSPVA
jgi:single-strand DNA-binding protein